VHDCTVENLSTLGACISFDAKTFAELTHKFDLTFDNCHTYWYCDVVWHNGHVGRIGVSWKTCWPIRGCFKSSVRFAGSGRPSTNDCSAPILFVGRL
jgi:hypothetical protein